jgi:hypothetical protein
MGSLAHRRQGDVVPWDVFNSPTIKSWRFHTQLLKSLSSMTTSMSSIHLLNSAQIPNGTLSLNESYILPRRYWQDSCPHEWNVPVTQRYEDVSDR